MSFVQKTSEKLSYTLNPTDHAARGGVPTKADIIIRATAADEKRTRAMIGDTMVEFMQQNPKVGLSVVDGGWNAASKTATQTYPINGAELVNKMNEYLGARVRSGNSVA